MIAGLFSLSLYTTMHVVISLAGIAAGFVVMAGMLKGQRRDGWTFWFIFFTLLTSITGFGFPFDHVLPSHIVGAISLLVLLIAIVARYAFNHAGAWRWLYVVAALVAQWFNVFVLVAQAFQKVPALQALAPTQSEPPFLIAQTVVMVLFIITGIAALRKFHPPEL
jgi:hypothetical protein